MRAGLLRHKIVFQTRSEVSDGLGYGGDVSWADTLTLRASIWPKKADESVGSGRVKQTTFYIIRVRYSGSIDSSMRIKYGARYFEILPVVNFDERDRVLEITAKEIL